CYYNVTGSSDIYFKPNNGLGTLYLDDGDVLDGSPHYVHFVVDVSSGEMYGYVDGQLKKTESATTSYSWQKGSGMRLGGYSSNNGLSGKMYEFRIYNRALSQSEIQSTINTSLGGSALCESPRTKVDAVVNHVEDITVNEPLPYIDTAD